jgi:hypothetical protein
MSCDEILGGGVVLTLEAEFAFASRGEDAAVPILAAEGNGDAAQGQYPVPRLQVVADPQRQDQLPQMVSLEEPCRF